MAFLVDADGESRCFECLGSSAAATNAQSREKMDQTARYWQIAGTPPDPRFLRQEMQAGAEQLPGSWEMTGSMETLLQRAYEEVERDAARFGKRDKKWFVQVGYLHVEGHKPAPTYGTWLKQQEATHPTARVRVVEDGEVRLGCARWAP